MTARRKAVVVTLGGLICLFVFGFMLFAARVNREPDEGVAQADGIVVLTGGPSRIEEAAKLLQDKHGDRLLISGINPQTGRESIKKLTQLQPEQFDCCVDLGYAAQDTVGNATETSKWVALHHYDRVIVVTSRFHMPRSLAELGRVLPGVELVAHPVPLPKGASSPWWLSVRTTRLIASEYVKFLPAAARLIVARTLSQFDGRSVASSANPPLSKTSRL